MATQQQQQQRQPHDLHFDVQNGGGGTGAAASSPSARPGDVPRPGEMDHLPDYSNQQQQQNSDGTGGSGSLQYIQSKLKQSSHPTVIVFHILFKATALFLYICGIILGISGAKFITLTVICILLLAADFWVVKNVTGRLLVGLRWWNKVDDDETKWIFESAEGNGKPVNKFDRSVFWTVLYVTPVIWIGFGLLCILRFNFNWLLIVVLAISLSGANVYGYYRCSKEQAENFQNMMQQGAQQGAMAVMRSNVLSVLTGTNTAAQRNNNNNNIV